MRSPERRIWPSRYHVIDELPVLSMPASGRIPSFKTPRKIGLLGGRSDPSRPFWRPESATEAARRSREKMLWVCNIANSAGRFRAGNSPVDRAVRGLRLLLPRLRDDCRSRARKPEEDCAKLVATSNAIVRQTSATHRFKRTDYLPGSYYLTQLVPRSHAVIPPCLTVNAIPWLDRMAGRVIIAP